MDYGFAAVEASREAESRMGRPGDPLRRWILEHLGNEGVMGWR
jgi:hypothetical protein